RLLSRTRTVCASGAPAGLIMFSRVPSGLCGGLPPAAALSAIPLDVIRSSAAVPAHIAGRFREPIGFQQSKDGQYYVFDRAAHTVYSIDSTMTTFRQVVMIGAEDG